MNHLLQIYEPGQTPEPHADDRGIAIGIDLGTTNSVVAIAHDGQVELIKDIHGASLIPSIVAYHKNGDVRVGDDARHVMGQTGQITISSVKRLMGKNAAQIPDIMGLQSYPIDHARADGMIHLKIHGRSITPIEISAEILKIAKARAEHALGKKVDRAVITVPAYFDDAARTATRDAARLAGLEILRLLNEPTAAAVAYGLDQNAQGIYAIYDLGGGTFDVSILKLSQGVFQVLATGGDTALGGDDIDRAIAEYWVAEQNATADQNNLQSLLHLARQAKEFLSQNDDWRGQWQGQDLRLSRAQMDACAEKIIQRTLQILTRVLMDANLQKSDIQDLVLVGGSTRMNLLRKKLQEFFGKPALSNLDPDTVVAAGAAIQAEALSKGATHLLLDVLPLSLGIETYGGLVSRVIERNTPIPASKAQEFTTYEDGQGAMAIHVLQGERETASDCRSLARFELQGIPPMTAGVARIRVTFTVDADGLLTVSAVEKTTGIQQRIEVKPTYGLSEDQMAQMLRDSMAHAEDDMEKRLALEAKIEAERLLHAISDALARDGALLPQTEYEKLQESAKNLRELLPSGSRDKIRIAAENLEQEFLPFAQIRLDRAISSNLTGQDVRSVKAS